ncbi:hypothetical protein CI41S_38970 [Bradyrhizobium ivorense]|nr:hypothetical protein CI41S_38970 [Bradyrhizobium ivorense]
MQGVTNPNEFLEQAAERGLNDLLTNPQNLVMLAKSVKDKNWPRNRTELFQNATELLLSEHNPSRARSGDGVYGADELLAPAGAVLATRLISDVGGVSLADNQATDDFPSYRTTPFPDREKVRAALGRRVFIGNGEEAADYTHRTTAEYVGATWLAKQIGSGLPIGRVRALMGVDGHPASELRGLNAWLAVLCPTHANELIDADPYGVLIYGDAASLSPSHRKRLLSSLALLSETDPWFGRDELTAPNVGALASNDLVPSFQKILRSKTTNFSLKRLVLSALATGTPSTNLSNDLLAIFLDAKAPYALRDLAFDGLQRLGAAGIDSIKNNYQQLKNSDSDIRLRATVLGELYRDFLLADCAKVLIDAMACSDDLPGGILLPLERAVPLADIVSLVTSLSIPDHRASAAHSAIARARRHNTFDVSFTVTRLIVRYLKAGNLGLSADAVWRMLTIRQSLEGSLGRSGNEELRTELEARPELLAELLEKALDALDETAPDRGVLWRFRETTLLSLDEKIVAQRLSARVLKGIDTPLKHALLYQLAIHLAIRVDNSHFDELYDYADSRSHLLDVRVLAVTSPLEDWQREDAARTSQRTSDEEQSAIAYREAFEREKSEIVSGRHLGWLQRLAAVYFDEDIDATPHKRLEQKIGTENAQIALAGFKACLQRTDLPSIKDVGKANVRNSYPRWWYALIAGMDERWVSDPTFDGLSDQFLETMAAVELVSITQRREGNTIFNMDHPWQKALLGERPRQIAAVYAQVASMALKGNASIIHGLHELISDGAFVDVRRSIILKLLRKHTAAPIQQLEQMLVSALADAAKDDRLSKLVDATLASRADLKPDQRLLWLAAGFLIAPDKYKKLVHSAGRKPDIVWHMRSLLRSAKSKSYDDLSVEQIEIMIRLAGRHFQIASIPSSTWGDRHPWEGSEFCNGLINSLSTRTSEAASSALARLSQNAFLTSYRDHIKHQRANQRARMREAEYRQPDWKQTAAALLNGPPANFADLQALVIDHCRDLNNEITNRNIDVYKQFWNEGSHGKVTKPRSEETSRDLLVGMLQMRLRPLGITVEPEGHMAADKRVDVSVAISHKKTLMEWKRDYHPDVWHAHTTQLDRLYTADPDASGYGIYGVFWFGPKRPRKLPARPDGGRSPSTAVEMQEILTGMMPVEKREKLSVVVMDVSGPAGARKSPKGTKRRGSRTRVSPSRKRKPSIVTKRAKKSASSKTRSKRKKRR